MPVPSRFPRMIWKGRICYGGLGLSSTTGITAFVLVFPPLDEEDKYYILPYFWIPEETLDLRVRRDHVPYDLWERQGTMLSIAATSRNSSNSWANGSISGKSLSTAGALCRWRRAWKAWALR